MCGRYALALRPSQVMQMLANDNVPVHERPDDDGPDTPRQSYNFAPGYHGIVYRANTSDRGSGVHPSASIDAVGHDDACGDDCHSEITYKLQAMKWGLIPFWTKRSPDYGTIMKTINCRDDSLATPGGLWNTMKARKRCVVIAQGFFEWLQTGPKDKLPHFIRRKDGRLMCFAGLWDCVQYEDTDIKTYTFTIITTDANKQMKFIHNRMPVVLEAGSDALRTWVDPGKQKWDRELQSLLKPFEGELDIYAVSKDVGKIGNDSPSFIVPLDSKENKSNIANFFANASKQTSSSGLSNAAKAEHASERDDPSSPETCPQERQLKRKVAEQSDTSDQPLKKLDLKDANLMDRKISAIKNKSKSPTKSKSTGTQKITSFFNATT